MEITTLCEKIKLQPAIKKAVLNFADEFDFRKVDKLFGEFRIYENMRGAYAELQQILGEDKDGIKMLACMLKASADIYEHYKENSISDDIYFATMSCYPRFVLETFRLTDRLEFDRGWWTTRQAGGHLFRIGELEYERKPIGDKCVIGIHVPSDADFSPDAVADSLQRAREFFAVFYPELAEGEFRCHSWLLDCQLKDMLDESSNIRSFQNRFAIFDQGEIGCDFMQWLYNTQTDRLSDLPEHTSLQRNMKKHLLAGGVIRNAYGRLIR